MDNSVNWTSKQDLMRSFGVDRTTIESVVEQLSQGIDSLGQSHIKNGGYHNSEVLYDDYLVNLIGQQLVNNQANQGRSSEIVKTAASKSMSLGNLTLAAMEDPKAWAQLKALGDAHMRSIAENKVLQIENKALQSKVEDVYIAERQFHEKTYSATEIAKKYNTTANHVGRIATKYNLKTDEFGFWSKSKATYCDKWIDVFRYNDKALEVFEKELC